MAFLIPWNPIIALCSGLAHPGGQLREEIGRGAHLYLSIGFGCCCSYSLVWNKEEEMEQTRKCERGESSDTLAHHCPLPFLVCPVLLSLTRGSKRDKPTCHQVRGAALGKPPYPRCCTSACNNSRKITCKIF